MISISIQADSVDELALIFYKLGTSAQHPALITNDFTTFAQQHNNEAADEKAEQLKEENSAAGDEEKKEIKKERTKKEEAKKIKSHKGDNAVYDTPAEAIVSEPPTADIALQDVTIDDLRAACGKLNRTSPEAKAAVKAAVAEMGVATFSLLDNSQLPEFYEKLMKISEDLQIPLTD